MAGFINSSKTGMLERPIGPSTQFEWIECTTCRAGLAELPGSGIAKIGSRETLRMQEPRRGRVVSLEEVQDLSRYFQVSRTGWMSAV
jgi:hypothetical protein